MRNWILPLSTLLCICIAGSALAEEHHIIIKQHTREVAPGEVYFDQHHNDKWAADALKQLGVDAPKDATPGQLAELTYAQLEKLPAFGEKSTAVLKAAYPDWFIAGYLHYQGASVQRSRFLNWISAYEHEGDHSGEPALPDARAVSDIAALYAYWSLYDAEWFSLSRTPGFKAWLSAVALTYPPQWTALQSESESELHARLVTPLQTPDEPYREIDNWISSFKNQSNVGGHGELGAFIKPKVRDALVQELLASGGMETDARFYEQRAYRSAEPNRTGLSEQQFFLLGALTLEYFQEIYAAHPDTKQPLHFREFFVSSFRNAT
jgi:hypothetical protein